MKSIDQFTGFTEETFRFFNGLRENNCKPWFDEHKLIYEEEVLRPMRAFALALTPAMYAIDPRMNLNPSKIVSRIYRDIRFSPDKTPYKTNMWIMFQRIVNQWENFPGFYIEIGADGYQYGMGLYLAKKNTMDSYRSKVEYEQEHFRSITTDLTGKHGFYPEGELYKRPIANRLPDYFQPWIQRKSIYLFKHHPIGKELFDEGFTTLIAREFSSMQPFYEFRADVCD
ncbi:MAG: DUF2461 domain-containing protein [Candidatus Symbiothrix sp.]|jgi:uncharacterized protein (TIGR02453 family)|nr:DUF2461 domain-containing protein [Candidatus Symbiothrix sp.]